MHAARCMPALEAAVPGSSQCACGVLPAAQRAAHHPIDERVLRGPGLVLAGLHGSAESTRTSGRTACPPELPELRDGTLDDKAFVEAQGHVEPTSTTTRTGMSEDIIKDDAKLTH